MALARALGAAAVLLALSVGVPYLLVATVGNPFPGSMPTVDEIRILLTQNGQGFTNFLIGTLAILIWVIWAQLMIALVAEVAATVRHRQTRHLRVAPGLQSVAARLIAALTLATTLAAGPLLAPAVGALSFSDVIPATPAAVSVVDGMQPSSTTQTATVGLDETVRASHEILPASVMIVDEYTELWDLAEAAYGDGVSWKLIAQANAGAHDAHGVVITNETETVAPGTELRLPGATDVAAVSAYGTVDALAHAMTQTPDAAVAAGQVVEVGDSMWTMAESEVERMLDRPATEAEVADYWFAMVAANQGIASGDVDLIYPGETLAMPHRDEMAASVSSEPATAPETTAAPKREPSADDSASDADSPSESQSEGSGLHAAALHGVADGPTTSRTASAHSVSSVDASDPEQAESDGAKLESPPAQTATEDSIPIPAIGMTALGAAMLGAGVLSAVRRRRDLQRRTRPSGTKARPASIEAAAFEAAIAHLPTEVHESELGLGWRVLPASSVPELRPAPTNVNVEGLVVSPVVLDVPSPQIDPVGREEVLTQHTNMTGRPPLHPEPLPVAQISETAPTTTVIGTDADTGEAVLIDLAAVETLELRGPSNDVRTVARSIVLDLAVSDRSDGVHVLAVGVAPELADLERVHAVETVDAAATLALRMGWLSPDATTPVVVVADSGPANDAGLLTLRQAGAVLVAPQIESGMWVEIAGPSATLQPAGQRVVIAAFDDDQYRSVSELIDTTSGAALEIVDDTVGVHEVLDVVVAGDCPIEAGALEVKVLGPVEVAGADSFSSLKAVDVVAYLAFHRHGVDADQIKTWVWPTFDPPTDKAFANVMSRARTGLGADEGGSPYLSRAGADKTYRLAAAVTTDFDRFRTLAERADESADPPTTLELYRQALHLIRGVPFTGGAASSFSWADNHVRAQVEYTIDEVVHRCADLALSMDDLATARWAALKGLELVPGCEQCFRRRFLIARAGNNRSELRRAMADLEASAMVDLGEPEAIDIISGDLLDLYHELDRALVGRAS